MICLYFLHVDKERIKSQYFQYFWQASIKLGLFIFICLIGLIQIFDSSITVGDSAPWGTFGIVWSRY